MTALRETDAKDKKRRKKRCKKLGDTCTPGAKRKCCGDLRCRTTADSDDPDTFCCRTEGQPCLNQRTCCDPFLCCGPTGAEVCSPALDCISDRNLKTNVGSVDPTDMLQRVRDLPISTWNYTSDDPSIRHIGSMAQDFAAAFGVGADDRHIHPIDGQGVALAAIQGLLAQIEELQAANAWLTARIDAMEKAQD
ncbi:MAG: tail fiber domain-containing protein [Thermomicrobiales bacterium]